MRSKKSPPDTATTCSHHCVVKTYEHMLNRVRATRNVRVHPWRYPIGTQTAIKRMQSSHRAVRHGSLRVLRLFAKLGISLAQRGIVQKDLLDDLLEVDREPSLGSRSKCVRFLARLLAAPSGSRPANVRMSQRFHEGTFHRGVPNECERNRPH